MLLLKLYFPNKIAERIIKLISPRIVQPMLTGAVDLRMVVELRVVLEQG
jgi:hypothetical protein